VLFDGHVEVVTKYAGGVLYTIGGDSMPNFSVNAHRYREPLDAQGVLGFVDNGELVTTASEIVPNVDAAGVDLGLPAIPGLLAPTTGQVGGGQQAAPPAQQQESAGSSAVGGAIIPGLEAPTGTVATGSGGQSSQAYGRHQAPAVQVPSTAEQQAFISQVAPGAIAAQLRYGIPASVTIAQAIDESGWGQSELATQDHNLFGIKGTGPAGAVDRPTEEYQGGRWVATTASFRVYHNVAQSIADHSTLLATGGSYQQAMADRQVPDAFANDLTGVYATDPRYGSSLISIMRLYNLYRYDTSTGSAPAVTVTPAPVVTQVAAADHSADLPGLESTALAFGGTSRSGASTDGSVHGVPRPRGTTLSSGFESSRAVSASAHRVRTEDGARRGGPTRGNLVRGERSRTSTRGRGTQDRVTQGSGAQDGQGRRSNDAVAQGGVAPGGARIPGLAEGYPAFPAASSSAAAGAARVGLVGGGSLALAGAYAARSRRDRGAAAARTNARAGGRPRPKRYLPQIPSVVTTDFMTMAKPSIARAKPLYQDVAREHGIRWELLAACDWMQCKADPKYSPVQGEKLGTRNDDGTVFRTKAEALAQTAADLIALADAVYHIDLTAAVFLSVADLARVFAAFRWGGLLRAHHVSAMTFPYSVEGLTAQHMDMHWPDIREPDAPDKPGGRFRMPFGAVPVVLTLDYPAVA
jgi:flagellum-specific peptidoglycan hydrolase FlgJ